MTSEGFKNKTQQFLTSFRQLLQYNGYDDVDVSIHAVYIDRELQWVLRSLNGAYNIMQYMYMIIIVNRVVVQLSGDQISAAKASELVAVVRNNADSLPVQVKNIDTGASYIFCTFAESWLDSAQWFAVPTQTVPTQTVPDSGLSVGAIVGIVVAAVVVLLMLAVLIGVLVLVVVLKQYTTKQVRYMYYSCAHSWWTL